MARESGGGGGAFGWTLLGILVGVAATLAVQTLVSNRRASEASVAVPVSSAHLAIAVAPPVVRPVVKAAPPPAVVAQKAPAATPVQEDVEDDAAAAGMTSRTRPSDTMGAPGPAGAPN
jgi:hypothetical protein